MSTKYILKSGKTFDAPSIFANPQTRIDASVLRNTIQEYPSETKYIEGIVISLKDWRDVRYGLNANQGALFDSLHVNEKIRIVDPSLHILFQGTTNDKASLIGVEVEKGKKLGDYQLRSGGHRLRDAIEGIGSITGGQNREKAEYLTREIYPYADLLIKPIMEFEIRENCDLIVVPSVPISQSSRLFGMQIQKVRSMNKAGKVLADTLLEKEMRKRDIMFLLTVNPSVLKPENFDDILSTLIITEEGKDTIYPDQIGIRVMNLDKNRSEDVQSIVDTIAALARRLELDKKLIPIHLFNVREFGYVGFCYGATTMTTPIARSPYIQIRSANAGKVDRRGRLYHMNDMEDYTYEKSLALSRSRGYEIPCYCSVCKEVGNYTKVQEPTNWNEFRRTHFLLAKDLEMREIKDAPTETINQHLKQKFSRSKQTYWLAFLDNTPVLTFR